MEGQLLGTPVLPLNLQGDIPICHSSISDPNHRPKFFEATYEENNQQTGIGLNEESIWPSSLETPSCSRFGKAGESQFEFQLYQCLAGEFQASIFAIPILNFAFYKIDMTKLS